MARERTAKNGSKIVEPDPEVPIICHCDDQEEGDGKCDNVENDHHNDEEKVAKQKMKKKEKKKKSNEREGHENGVRGGGVRMGQVDG